MELQSLRTFLAVVEEGGIQSASRRLNTVRSNVTTRIQRLEEELGTALFHRKGRGLTLAPPGRVLVEYARKMSRLESRAALAVRRVGDQGGELRVGAMETFAALRLPEALREVRAHHAGVTLRVESGTSADLVARVVEHRLDGAVVGGPVEHPELRVTELARERLVRVWAAGEPVEGLPLVLFREGCAYRARALAWRRECGEPIADVMEFGTLDGILGCVAVGLGQTLMPRWVVEGSRHRDALETEAIDPRFAQVPTVLIRPRDGLPMRALDTLEAYLVEGASTDRIDEEE